MIHMMESCSLKLLFGKDETTNTIKSQNAAHEKISNSDSKNLVQTDKNMSRIVNVTKDGTASGKLQNQTRPGKSARWDQYHRFPQTIEAAPGKIHSMIEATKRLLDPFQIARVVMESVPEAVKNFAWYLIIGIAAAWTSLVFVIILCVSGKLLECGRCFVKNSRRSMRATKGCLKRTYCHTRRQNTDHELIQSNP